MIFFLVLAALAVLAVVMTFVAVASDGYGATPIDHSRIPDAPTCAFGHEIVRR